MAAKAADTLARSRRRDGMYGILGISSAGCIQHTDD
jgi:hypothetical protein